MVHPPTHADMIGCEPAGGESQRTIVDPQDQFRRLRKVHAKVQIVVRLLLAGRWLRETGDPDGDYSNGWPFAGYSNTQYNHVAPPNWSGYDCGIASYIPDTPWEHAIVAPRS